MKHQAYLKTVAHRWLVWITPASRVGGEFALPVPCQSRKTAQLYARACRRIGQLARVSPPAQP